MLAFLITKLYDTALVHLTAEGTATLLGEPGPSRPARNPTLTQRMLNICLWLLTEQLSGNYD